MGFAGKDVEGLEKEDVLTNIVVMKLDMLRCACGSYALDLCGAKWRAKGATIAFWS